MNIVGSGLAFIVAAISMEGVAWFTHKYVMHGFLWVLHRDHHQPQGRGLQKNDLFALFFAGISILLIVVGVIRGWAPMAAAGFGVALYGLGYGLFHEIMVHRRVPGLRLRPKGRYLRRIVRAHRTHHKHSEKEGGTSFSFLYAPKKYAPER